MMLKVFFALFESKLVYISVVSVFAIVHVKLWVNLGNTDFSILQKYLPDFLVFCWKARCQNCGHHWCQHRDWQRDSHRPGEERLVWLKSKAEVTPHTHPNLTSKNRKHCHYYCCVMMTHIIVGFMKSKSGMGLIWYFQLRSFKTQF